MPAVDRKQSVYEITGPADRELIKEFYINNCVKLYGRLHSLGVGIPAMADTLRHPGLDGCVPYLGEAMGLSHRYLSNIEPKHTYD